MYSTILPFLLIVFLLFLFLSSRQTSDGNTVLLVDLNINNNNQSIIDEIFQFIGTKPEEAVSELYMYMCIQAYGRKDLNISTPST